METIERNTTLYIFQNIVAVSWILVCKAIWVAFPRKDKQFGGVWDYFAKHVSKHIRILMAIPPNYAVSAVIGQLKQ